MPAACRTCERPLRAPGSDPVIGTVAFKADGQCGSCYNATRAGLTITPRTVPADCARCSRPMRTKSKVEPGFVAHWCRGMCRPCYDADYRAERALLAYALGNAS